MQEFSKLEFPDCWQSNLHVMYWLVTWQSPRNLPHLRNGNYAHYNNMSTDSKKYKQNLQQIKEELKPSNCYCHIRCRLILTWSWNIFYVVAFKNKLILLLRRISNCHARCHLHSAYILFPQEITNFNHCVVFRCYTVDWEVSIHSTHLIKETLWRGGTDIITTTGKQRPKSKFSTHFIKNMHCKWLHYVIVRNFHCLMQCNVPIHFGEWKVHVDHSLI
jgi:hypothetical protein